MRNFLSVIFLFLSPLTSLAAESSVLELRRIISIQQAQIAELSSRLNVTDEFVAVLGAKCQPRGDYVTRSSADEIYQRRGNYVTYEAHNASTVDAIADWVNHNFLQRDRDDVRTFKEAARHFDSKYKHK
jgi:hypothetical protein